VALFSRQTITATGLAGFAAGLEDVTMPQYGTWYSYSGSAKLILAVVLLTVAVAVAFAGVTLPLPARLPRPGQNTTTLMVVAWGSSITAFLACVGIYGKQAHQEHLAGRPADNIFPITLIAAGVTFFIIAVNGKPGGKTAVLSGAIAAMAALMVFELPFDLIVMARTYPPIPPNPALYRAVFFAPLFLVEITTLALLTWPPMVRLTRATFFAFALMLAVFAVWAVAGFDYPSAPLPYALNVVAKLLAFATILTLFLPLRAEAEAEDPHAGQARAPA
jgi:hypothetical protein